MKNFLIASLFFIAISCANKEQKTPGKGYKITVRVKGLPSSRIYMNAMKLDSAGQAYWPVVDSADFVNGSFILQRDTQLIEPAWSSQIFYIDSVTGKKSDISFNNKYFSTKDHPSKYASFILENSAITISGDIKDRNGLKLSGSKESDFDFKYGLMQPPMRVYTINQKIDSARQTADTSVIASLRMQKEDILKKYKANFTRIISGHPSYFQALCNVYTNADYFTVDELQQFNEMLDKKLLKLPTGKKLITFTENKRKLSIGNRFGDFSYMDTTGKKMSLADVKGRNGTLIVFWASWCGPCRQEIPQLKKLYEEYDSKGISIVSISCDNNRTAWKNALKKEQMAWTNLSNLPGFYGDIYSKYNIKAIPLMFLLDSDNKILCRAMSIEEVEGQFNKLSLVSR